MDALAVRASIGSSDHSPQRAQRDGYRGSQTGRGWARPIKQTSATLVTTGYPYGRLSNVGGHPGSGFLSDPCRRRRQLVLRALEMCSVADAKRPAHDGLVHHRKHRGEEEVREL